MVNRKKIRQKRKGSPKPRRFDYTVNHQKVEAALFKVLKDTRSFPTSTQLAEITGMTRESVARHLQEIRLDSFLPKYKHMTPRVMLGIAGAALRGNPNAAKLWLQVVEGFTERIKTGQDDGRAINPYSNMTDDELNAEIEREISKRKK